MGDPILCSIGGKKNIWLSECQANPLPSEPQPRPPVLFVQKSGHLTAPATLRKHSLQLSTTTSHTRSLPPPRVSTASLTNTVPYDSLNNR